MLETAQINKMSMAERLQTMERLWDSLRRSESELPSPAWHEKVLSQRKERAAHGDARFLTLDQLKMRLRGPEAMTVSSSRTRQTILNRDENSTNPAKRGLVTISLNRCFPI
jgi:hypothetical protein